MAFEFRVDVRILAAAAALGIGAAIAALAPAAHADTADRPDNTRRTAVAHTKSVRQVPARQVKRAAVRANPGLSIKPAALSPFTLSSGRTGAAELSGLAYAGGTTYYSVGDNGATSIWQLYGSLTAAAGTIRSGFVSSSISAPALGSDSEGIALTPAGTGVWVADEIASTITEFSLATGLALGSVSVPSIYRPANVQGNFGLESLSYGAGALWTANEEALRPDGPLSTTTAGSWVRLQKFTGPDFTATAQYGYRTDRITALSPFIDVERSGLVDLAALPDGQLLALEREVGGFLPMFRSRIYLVDLAAATDTTDVVSLEAGGFTPVTKTLLWQGFFPFANFEGMSLGPQLSNGSYSLMLVSDNAGGLLGQRQNLLSLTLRGLPV